MTTVLAIRGKKGVYIASDTRICRDYNDGKTYREIGKTSYKFIRTGYGFYATAGDLPIASWIKWLLTSASVLGKHIRDGLEFESFSSLSLDASKETIERSVRVFFTSVFYYINNSKTLKESLKGQDISFFYIDKNRVIEGDFSTKMGLYSLKIQLFDKNDFLIAAIGSGGEIARKYAKIHLWDRIKGDEVARRAVKSATSQDYGSGGKIITSVIWNNESIAPDTNYLKNKDPFNSYKNTLITDRAVEIERDYFGGNIARVFMYGKIIKRIYLNYDLRDHFIAIVNYAKEYYDADVYSILPLNLCARSG